MLEFRVRQLDETTSTNDEVKRALEAGEPEGLAVLALRQTGGYGRQGRAWASPEGGLYLSLLLRPQVDAAVLPTLSLVTGLAVRRAAAELLPPDAGGTVLVKWPNDLVVPAACRPAGIQPASGIEYRKLCGISLEAHAGGVCVGIGVNVEPPDRADVAKVGGKNVPVYLPELGFEGCVDDVAAAVLRAYAPLYRTWLSEGFAPLVDEYAAHASLTGRSVRMVNRSGEPVAQGTVASVDEFGRLVLRASDGSLVPVASGEAHLV
ncbi:biotin--[acetyl-CoA-carboxylase] ligase [Gordonibacter sp. 28C]|uniref:biotin--[acetyl-CoA-carboxylase] ligase n=1 Tax=Gordonibacter sp. 28C TaxID=2078569 RepID=UPI000DF77713|nr:biotin--[acetyl-CoA-carboxylase] ligase [Gordonibacter sp. 28C]RDB64740.1 biotin--[acetyl-CoA-carboxylase] ligase [Gordonibacter sp. 28C]